MAAFVPFGAAPQGGLALVISLELGPDGEPWRWPTERAPAAQLGPERCSEPATAAATG